MNSENLYQLLLRLKPIFQIKEMSVFSKNIRHFVRISKLKSNNFNIMKIYFEKSHRLKPKLQIINLLIFSVLDLKKYFVDLKKKNKKLTK